MYVYITVPYGVFCPWPTWVIESYDLWTIGDLRDDICIELSLDNSSYKICKNNVDCDSTHLVEDDFNEDDTVQLVEV